MSIKTSTTNSKMRSWLVTRQGSGGTRCGDQPEGSTAKGERLQWRVLREKINAKRPKEHEKTTTINLDELQKRLEREGHSAKQLTGGQKSSSYTLYKILAVNQKSLVVFLPKEGNKEDIVKCVIKYVSELCAVQRQAGVSKL